MDTFLAGWGGLFINAARKPLRALPLQAEHLALLASHYHAGYVAAAKWPRSRFEVALWGCG